MHFVLLCVLSPTMSGAHEEKAEKPTQRKGSGVLHGNHSSIRQLMMPTMGRVSVKD